MNDAAIETKTRDYVVNYRFKHGFPPNVQTDLAQTNSLYNRRGYLRNSKRAVSER